MKYSQFTIITLFFLSTALNAQITKGNWMVGGNAYFNSSTIENTNPDGSTGSVSGSGININPTIGYFIINNFSIGLSGNFGLSIPEQGSNLTSLGVGPFVRYYFLKPEKTVNLLSQIGYNYITSSSDSKFNSYNFRVGPVIYFNSSVGLELTIDYSISKITNRFSESTSKAFNVGFGFQIHLEK
jgi:hypothetical protein